MSALSDEAFTRPGAGARVFGRLIAAFPLHALCGRVDMSRVVKWGPNEQCENICYAFGRKASVGWIGPPFSAVSQREACVEPALYDSLPQPPLLSYTPSVSTV